jgi:3D (Asp-Asp-Asp) domain-containing protein/peptidoglycan hydrolase CwlO-like protein
LGEIPATFTPLAGRRTRVAAFLGIAVAAVFAAVSGATAAGPRLSLAQIQAQKRAAVLDLYALDMRVAAAQRKLTALQQRAAALKRQQQQLQQQIGATHTTLVTSQEQLALHLRRLYKDGDVSALAVVLGAKSLDDALSQLDTLSAAADQSLQIVGVTRRAQIRLATLRGKLTARRARVDAAVESARRTLEEVTVARAQRASFIASLRTKERLKRGQIAALETTVQHAQKKSETLTTEAAAPTPTPVPEPAVGGRTLTVSSTGYALPGRTATGLPVGWGVVAVDPSVIPLGTKMTIPGYGEGVAADTGSAVRGAEIDLWFPSLAQARAWGRRTVTITLH